MNRVHVIRYGWRDGVRGDHFLDDDRPHEPHPTAYYVWLVRSPGGAVLIDTGMGRSGADRVPGLRRGPAVADALRTCGVPPETVETVVLTHLHYDHAGGVRDFPNARYVIQKSEVDDVADSWLVDRADVDHLLQSNRLDLVDGDVEIAVGITVHHVGGHTPGMQVVRILTRLGHAVVASDASHFYENLERGLPCPILHSIDDAQRAFARIDELADHPGLILPGHDPAALDRTAGVLG